MAVPLMVSIEVELLFSAVLAAEIERGECTQRKLRVQLICGLDVWCVARDDVRDCMRHP
jgi:hypothetical protein